MTITCSHWAFERLSRIFNTHGIGKKSVWRSTPLSSPPCCKLARHGLYVENILKKKFERFNWANHWQILSIKEQNGRTKKWRLEQWSFHTQSSSQLVRTCQPLHDSRGPSFTVSMSMAKHIAVPQRVKDQMKYYFVETGIRLNTWETEATDRPSRRRTIHFGCSTFEEKRKTEAEVNLKQRRPGNSSQKYHPSSYTINIRDFSISQMVSWVMPSTNIVVATNEPNSNDGDN